jgi:outer membrane lipoprotein
MQRKALTSLGSVPFVLIIIPFFLLLLVSGCATTQKQPTRQKVAYEKISFPEILKSPETYTGKVVRLGGVIIATENREKETILEILEKPLTSQGRPKSGDVSGGRFMVVFEKFLDKATYRPDRPVTVTGEIIGMKTGLIGEATYHYPLLSGQDIRLWQERGYWDRSRLGIGIGIGGGNVGVGVGTSF